MTCSELPSSLSTPLEPKVSAHKRQGNPSLLVVEDKSSKRRHCIIDGNDSQAKIEATSSDEKNAEFADPAVIAECGETFNKGSGGVTISALNLLSIDIAGFTNSFIFVFGR